MKTRFLFALGVISLLAVIGNLLAGQPQVEKKKEFRITRSISAEGRACIECHKETSPGLFADWAHGSHARASVTCIDCHKADKSDKDISTEHYKQYARHDLPYGKRKYEVPISAAVTPKDCSRCHPDEAAEYARSKHANTIEIIWKIDPWLNKGMNSEIERQTGCYACHGTVLEVKNGKLTSNTWPNVGVGRINLDGSRGSCTSCHTRHKFSLAEARKPQACGQCHLGPDHPQIEIFRESKHGAIFESEGDGWKWDAAPGTWTAGVDYRTPTCSTCHMSGVGELLTTHDVTERLAWETQAPLTVRPSAFKAFPAKTNFQIERNKMKEVCLQCHGNLWTDSHFERMDKAILEYNNVYYKPAKKMLDDLYAKGKLDNAKFFDEDLEIEFYELWHHEGRRARMGAAMMAPDYAWWHGFYELKKRFNTYMHEGNNLLSGTDKAHVHKDYPNATGTATPPAEIKKEEK
ncbi:MAG: multiheme c-type cytochrome [Planctomycetota bacterium]|jgi:hypothetical protein